MSLYQSKVGEIQTLEQWQEEVDKFWEYVRRQHVKSYNRQVFVKPLDAFERYAKLLGLKEIDVNWEGVF